MQVLCDETEEEGSMPLIFVESVETIADSHDRLSLLLKCGWPTSTFYGVPSSLSPSKHPNQTSIFAHNSTSTSSSIYLLQSVCHAPKPPYMVA